MSNKKVFNYTSDKVELSFSNISILALSYSQPQEVQFVVEKTFSFKRCQHP